MPKIEVRPAASEEEQPLFSGKKREIPGEVDLGVVGLDLGDSRVGRKIAG